MSNMTEERKKKLMKAGKMAVMTVLITASIAGTISKANFANAQGANNVEFMREFYAQQQETNIKVGLEENGITLAKENTVSISALAVNFFKDVPANHWAKETIDWAVQKGVVTGYPDGTFKPANEVTESEFLAMLIRVYKPDLKPIAGAHWAQHYYKLAQENNYPIGKDNRNTVITRGYVAELVAATQGVNYVGDDAIRYLLGNELAKGTDPNKITIKSYNKEGKLSRAEAVQFIKNLIEKGNQELGARPTTPSDVSQLPSLPGSGAIMIGDVEYIGPAAIGIGAPSQIQADSIARPIMRGIIEGITAKEGMITVKIPNLPKGYEIFLKYSDSSGPNGTSSKEKSFMVDPAKEDNTYSIPYYGSNGQVVVSIGRFDNGLFHSVDNAFIKIPSMKMTSDFGGW